MIIIKKKKLTKKQIIIITLLVILTIACLVGCVFLIPYLMKFNTEENVQKLETFIDNLGIWGILMFLLLQVLQIFIAIIPGEVVELAGGALYGTWGGLILCLIGNVIGSLLIYVFVKFIAKNKLEEYKNKLKQYPFLSNKNKVALYLFIIFLIPGLPKDIFTYLVPFLPINFFYFLFITCIARIPSIISSTAASDLVLENNYTLPIIITAIFLVLGILGFLFKDKIMARLNKDNDEDLKKQKVKANKENKNSKEIINLQEADENKTIIEDDSNKEVLNDKIKVENKKEEK